MGLFEWVAFAVHTVAVITALVMIARWRDRRQLELKKKIAGLNCMMRMCEGQLRHERNIVAILRRKLRKAERGKVEEEDRELGRADGVGDDSRDGAQSDEATPLAPAVQEDRQ